MTNAPQLRLGSSLQDFMRILQLDLSDVKDKELYRTMVNEVDQGRIRLCYDRRSLLPQFVNNPTVQAPFNRTQIDYAVFLQESETIYKSASPESRARYNLANHSRRSDCPTPAVNWMLWQALRFGEQFGQ